MGFSKPAAEIAWFEKKWAVNGDKSSKSGSAELDFENPPLKAIDNRTIFSIISVAPSMD